MRNKILMLIVCMIGLPVWGNWSGQTACADTITTPKPWKFDGIIGLNATGTGLVNWSGGGKNTVCALTFAKLHLRYYKDALAWETDLDTDFGLTWTQQDEDRWKKSADNIKLNTKFGWEFKPDWFLTIWGEFQSQYAVGRDMKKGYDPPISKFLAPSYTYFSIGFDWKKNVNGCDFSVYMSPISMQVTTAYVSDKMNDYYTKEHREMMSEDTEYDFRRALQTKYSTYKVVLDANGFPQIEWHNARVEAGLALKGTLAYKYDNMTLRSTLLLFTPYQGRGYDVKEAYEKAHPGETWNYPLRYSNMNRQFGYFDVDWDTSLSYQFAKVLNVTLSTCLKYFNGTLIADSNGVEKERVQFKAVVGIGLGYSF